MECSICGCGIIENQELQLCASCNRDHRKAQHQATKSKVATPVNKVSPKRAEQNKEYLKLRKEYLDLYPVCEVPECNLKAVDIHHQRGRSGDMLTNVSYFMAVCRKHHIEIENNPNWAKEQGFSFKRITEVK